MILLWKNGIPLIICGQKDVKFGTTLVDSMVYNCHVHAIEYLLFTGYMPTFSCGTKTGAPSEHFLRSGLKRPETMSLTRIYVLLLLINILNVQISVLRLPAS